VLHFDSVRLIFSFIDTTFRARAMTGKSKQKARPVKNGPGLMECGF